MKTITKIEEEINQIRLQIYEETKGLTPEQRKRRLSGIVDAAQREFGFKRTASPRNNLREAQESCG